MTQLRKLLSLPLRDKALLWQAAVLLAGFRLTLTLLPFAATRRILCRASRPARPSDEPLPAERIAWGVKTASRVVPGASHCLTQALAAQFLLLRNGYPAEVHFGVPRKQTSTFVAHAWTEVNGVVVIGGDNAMEQRYVKLRSSMNSPM